MPVAPPAGRVDRLGHQLLAGTALATDHHRHIVVRNGLDELPQPTHGRAVAHHRAERRAGAAGRAQGIAGAQAGAFQGAVDDQLQLVQIDRLDQVIHCAQAHGLHGLIDGTEGREHDHRAGLGDLRQRAEVPRIGQIHVQQHQLRRVALEAKAGLGPGARGGHVETRTGQGLDEQVVEDGVVFDHQDGALHGDSPSAAGRRTWKVLPTPGVLSTPIRPPCRSTMALQMARPSPEPCWPSARRL